MSLCDLSFADVSLSSYLLETTRSCTYALLNLHFDEIISICILLNSYVAIILCAVMNRFCSFILPHNS